MLEYYNRDTRSLEFTVTRSFMKLFQTGSAAIVIDCQIFFHFLPVTYQIDIPTAKFLNKFWLVKIPSVHVSYLKITHRLVLTIHIVMI